MPDDQDVLIFDEDEGKPAINEAEQEEETPETAVVEEHEAEEEEPRPGARAKTPEEKLRARNAALRKTRAENARKDRELADMRDQLARVTQSTQILTQAQVQAVAGNADEELRQGIELRRQALAAGNVDALDRADEIIFQARTKKQQIATLRTQQPQRQQVQPQGDRPNATREAWLARNPWFHEDPVRKAAVIAASNAAAAEGYDPHTQDHFDRIDEVIGNNKARRKPPQMSPGVTRGPSGTKPGQIAVPRHVYNEWEKAGQFDGQTDAEKKATLRELASSYQQSVEKTQAWNRRG